MKLKKHNLKLFLFLPLLTAFFFTARLAWAETPATAPSKSENVETILATLNETLEENRTLRNKVNEYEDTMRKMVIDQGSLRSQVRTLSGQKTEKEQKAEEEAKRLAEELAQLKITVAQQKEMNQNMAGIEMSAKGDLDRLAVENANLKRMLDHAVLEEERDQYKHLLRDTQKNTDRALGKMSKIVTENERMKTELSALYYSLGNILYRSRDYQNALVQYERATQLNPADSWPHYNMGIIYDYYLNDNENAVKHYRKYLDLKSVEEEADEIRERVVQLELEQEITPNQPLKTDYQKNSKRQRNIFKRS